MLFRSYGLARSYASFAATLCGAASCAFEALPLVKGTRVLASLRAAPVPLTIHRPPGAFATWQTLEETGLWPFSLRPPLKGTTMDKLHQVQPNSSDEGESYHEHVQLVLRMDAVSINEARLRAWIEGPTGYTERKEAMGETDQ